MESPEAYYYIAEVDVLGPMTVQRAISGLRSLDAVRDGVDGPLEIWTRGAEMGFFCGKTSGLAEDGWVRRV